MNWNWNALQENIAPIFASNGLILDPQGICLSGHSHTSLQDHSNRVLRHQELLWVPGVEGMGLEDMGVEGMGAERMGTETNGVEGMRAKKTWIYKAQVQMAWV